MDPITKEMEKKPLKPFMVNQLQILIERNDLILSPYDDVLFKQLVNYEVEKITDSGIPKYTSENEHFVDALGLSYLAMVLEFKDIAGIIEDVKTSNKIEVVKKSFGTAKVDSDLEGLTRDYSNNAIKDFYKNTDFTEHRSDRQTWVKVDYNYKSSKGNIGGSRSSWGSRSASFNSRGGFSR